MHQQAAVSTANSLCGKWKNLFNITLVFSPENKASVGDSNKPRAKTCCCLVTLHQTPLGNKYFLQKDFCTGQLR